MKNENGNPVGCKVMNDYDLSHYSFAVQSTNGYLRLRIFGEHNANLWLDVIDRCQ